MKASAFAVGGTYYFKVTFGSTASAIATLVILTPTVSIGAQSGTITGGAEGTATFAVTTAKIASGTAGIIMWYTSSAGTTTTSAPTGVTPTVSSVANNSSTVTITASSSGVEGTYYFAVTFVFTSSSVATLTIIALTALGTGDGTTTIFYGSFGAAVTVGSVEVVAQAVAGFDNGAGSITSAGFINGTIHYATGVVSVTFTAAPAAGIVILGYASLSP